MALRLVILVVCLGLAAASAGAAITKDMRPGTVRVCGTKGCVALRSQPALDALSTFYYGPHLPKTGSAPRTRAPCLKLEYRNGYITGVAAGAQFDRFLSFGVNLQQFKARVWYRIPTKVALALRALAARAGAGPLPANILQRSH